MSKTYFPDSTQFKRINSHLKAIASALGYDIDISTWKGIQNAVRSGVAPSVLPVGTQLSVSHGVYGDFLYDVVAHDYLKSNHDENAHTMTLMCHNVLPSLQYDEREAFYYANVVLLPGTYTFTIPEIYGSWAKGTYCFTLTKSLPPGGQLCLQNGADSPMTSQFVMAFASDKATSPIETVQVSMGFNGTSLGTFGVELNHVHRVAHGSDNYKESALRQFLNSSGTKGNVWTPQTKYDRPPEWLTTTDGFMAGLGDDFLAVVGSVIVPCATNAIFESPDSTVAKGEKYTVTDKFYLASAYEVVETPTLLIEDDSRLLPYYEGATAAERIKYRDNDNEAEFWRLRSPVALTSNHVDVIDRQGYDALDLARLPYSFAPMCTIV